MRDGVIVLAGMEGEEDGVTIPLFFKSYYQ